MFGFDLGSSSGWMKKARGQYEGILGGMARSPRSQWDSIFGKRKRKKKKRDLVYQQFNESPSQTSSRRDIHLQNAAQGVRGVDLRPGGAEHAKRKARQSLASKALAATPAGQIQGVLESGSGGLQKVLGGLYGKKNVGKVGAEIGRAKKKVKKRRRKAKGFFKKLF